MIKIKIVLLGDIAVGKSSYIMRLNFNKFFNYMDSTIGAAFSTKIMNIDGKSVKIEFWDTAGQERYKSLISMYYNNADAALIFYDINKLETLTNAIKLIDTLKSRGPVHIKYILIGNKYDLLDDHSITIDTVKAKLLNSENQNVEHVYTSAKTNYNVEFSINKLIHLINLDHKMPIDQKTNILNCKYVEQNTCCY
tara:strand:- start:583 stop:1167 length:585 start_codon:yes stop_codon:yes gene_type:complete